MSDSKDPKNTLPSCQNNFFYTLVLQEEIISNGDIVRLNCCTHNK